MDLDVIRKILVDAKFVAMAVVIETDDGKNGVYVYTHGVWRTGDLIDIITQLGNNFGLAIPIIGVNKSALQISKKPNVRYIN